MLQKAAQPQPASQQPQQLQPQVCGCPNQTPKYICTHQECAFHFTKRFYCIYCVVNHEHAPYPRPEIGQN